MRKLLVIGLIALSGCEVRSPIVYTGPRVVYDGPAREREYRRSGRPRGWNERVVRRCEGRGRNRECETRRTYRR